MHVSCITQRNTFTAKQSMNPLNGTPEKFSVRTNPSVRTDCSNPDLERPRNFCSHGFTSDQRHPTWLTWTPSSVTNSSECGTTFSLSETSGAYPRHPSYHSSSIFPERISPSLSVCLNSSGFAPHSAQTTRSVFQHAPTSVIVSPGAPSHRDRPDSPSPPLERPSRGGVCPLNPEHF